jgi:hypothetical protein
MNQSKIASILVVAILLSVLLAYFGRPKPPLLELVTARQELPDLAEHLPGSTALADRVTKSYRLAMVLVKTPYSADSAVALESLRTWAAERFQREPGFLHPVALEPAPAPIRTFVDSLFYNLGAYVYFGLEEIVGNCLQAQIARFHETQPYAAFRNSYFELFGMDADSATLLARYQSQRAKIAVDVVLWSILWAIALGIGAGFVLRGQPGTKFDRLRRMLAAEWLLLAGCYLLSALGENQVSMLVSSVVAAAAGIYLRNPFMLLRRENGGVTIQPVTIPSRWIAIALWTTYSLAAIQVLSWIRVGTLNTPDPVTLLLSSSSGNFLLDPAADKRNLMRLFGIVWLALGLWTLWQSQRDAAVVRETEKALASLQGPFAP